MFAEVCIRAFLSNKRLERNFLSSYDLVSGPAIAPVPAHLKQSVVRSSKPPPIIMFGEDLPLKNTA